MTDLLNILPSFPVARFAALLPALEQHAFTTTDLLALHPADVAKQTHLSLLDIKRLVATVQVFLSDDLVPQQPLKHLNDSTTPNPVTGVLSGDEAREVPRTEVKNLDEPEVATKDWPPVPEIDSKQPPLANDAAPTKDCDETPPPQDLNDDTSPASPPSLSPTSLTISTLDNDLDKALGGGIPVGCISEFAGESGVGKTQFLLALCLAVQLPPPYGLSKQALYISTESGLATKRLAQMLELNPTLNKSLADDAGAPRPSLDNILSTVTPDLESQDHILEYQVPVLLSRHNIGLLVLDSVAANYRAEFERQGSTHGSNMATRSQELVRLGAHLRNIARRHNIAVVVANQVADRFTSPAATRGLSSFKPRMGSTQESPLASRGMPPPPPATMSSTPSSSIPFSFPEDGQAPAPPALLLDHQQRWFTGWGDDPHASHALKTPSLGLVWSTQLACRIALFKRPVYGRPRRMAAPIEADDYDEEAGMTTLHTWRRWMKIVFAPHVCSSAQGVNGAKEFEVTTGGLSAVNRKPKVKRPAG